MVIHKYKNWSVRKRLAVLAVLCLIYFLSGMVISKIFPPTPTVRTAVEPARRARFYLYPPAPEDYHPSSLESYIPFIRMTPDSPFYIVSYFYEERDKNLQTYPLLFLAEKRIREVEQWKDNLKTLNSPEATDAAKLLHWWEKTRPKLDNLKYLESLGSYESETARYGATLLERKNEIEKITDESEQIMEYGNLRNFIKNGYPRIHEAIKSSRYDNGTKKYLDDMFYNMQAYLIKTIRSEYGEYSPSRLRYSLEKILAGGQYGKYKITIEWPEGAADLSNKSAISIRGEGVVEGNILTIGPKSEAVILAIPDLNMLQPGVCGESQYIIKYPQFDKYLLTIPHQSEHKVIYTLKEAEAVNTDNIFEREIGKEGMLDPGFYTIGLPQDKPEALYLFETRNNPDEPCDTATVSARLEPVIEPIITLDKISSVNNHTSTQPDTYGVLAGRILAVMKFAIVLYIFILIPSILRLIDIYLNNPPHFVLRMRAFYALVFVCGAMIDIFRIAKSSEMIILILYLCYMLTVASYRLGIARQLYIAISLFAMVPFAYILDKTVVADKLGVWSFLILLTAFVQIYFDKDPDHKDEFLKNFKKDIKQALSFRRLDRLINNIVRSIRTHIVHYYGKKQKGAAGWVNYAWKSLLLSFALTCGIYLLYSSYVFIDIKVEEYKAQKLLMKRTPKVNYYGPSVVYRGTKVVIKGGEFDWKQYNSVKLMSKYGEVNTDFWSDSKIIFTVPFDWKAGEIYLTIEKPMRWLGGWYIIKSDPIKIRLLKITDSFTKDDELYYKQFDNLDKETRQLNGY